MVNILPGGGRGIGVNPYGSAYPFVDPSPDVRHLLADAYFCSPYGGAPPLSCTRLAGFGAAFVGPPVRCDIEIRDARGAVLFDSTAADVQYVATPFGARLLVHEWYAGESVCRVVQHTAFSDDDAVITFPDVIVPADGRLDERVSQVIPYRVHRVLGPRPEDVLAGDLSCTNGYNTTIDVADAAGGLRATTRLIWSAEPGSGLGRYPGCGDPVAAIRTINGVGPGPTGDFAIAATGCYWARQPVTVAGGVGVATPHTLALGDDCGPCCECDDFVRVQRGALRTWGRFVQLAGEAEAARDSFGAVVERWRQEKECVDAKVVTISLVPSGIALADALITLCNHTDRCLVDATLTITASTDAPGSSGAVVPGTTLISTPGRGLVPYTMGGRWPVYVAHFDAIQAMDRGILRTRFRVVDASAGTHLRVTVVGSAATPPAGLQLPQTAEAIVTLGG